MTLFAVTELYDRLMMAWRSDVSDGPGSHLRVWVNWKSCGWNGWFLILIELPDPFEIREISAKRKPRRLLGAGGVLEKIE